ncbi:uncharacterized protein LOC128216861 [Mya arenaria]|uniref:uncharacterized protein LOC128216861 n=1 Tax=Mya arenaria TaxID=6604 RepID=UPI0022E512B8|nr:uncharacterized protein LOC128216861 [Mya arenaria]
METSNCCDVLLCYICAHILVLLCFSRVFVNGDQAIYVTNDTCGKIISFASTDVIHFHYDGSKWYDEGGHHFRRCEIKISNKHKDTELCIASPYSRYTSEWIYKCTARFHFSFRYYVLPCFEYTFKENCENSEEALAVFFYPVVFKEGDFEIKIYTRYRAPTTTWHYDSGGDSGNNNNYNDDDDDDDGAETSFSSWGVAFAIVAVFVSFCACLCRVSRSRNSSGQNVGTDGLSHEPFQVDMPVIPRSNYPPPSGQNVGTAGLSHEPFQVDMLVIPRSDSPPPYDSLIVNGMDKYGAQRRDPSIPPYLSATDSNTNHPSAPPLTGEQPQNRAWNCSPQLPSASPHSGEPRQNGAYNVPHQEPSVSPHCEEPPQNGAYNVQYSVEESENRHTHRTPGFSTSNNNETSQIPPHAATDFSELPPPPSYEMVVSADSPYLTSDSNYRTDTSINAASSH